MALVPVNLNNPLKINSVLEISRTNLPLSNLVPGETLTLSVVEKLSSQQYLLALKDSTITATSELPLRVGENLQVKVQSIQPQIILSLVDAQKAAANAKINEGLLQWRIHPDALSQLLGKVSEFAAYLKSGNLPLAMSGKDIDSLLELFGKIVFSSKTKTNPLFVKEFVSRLGLLLENNLGRLAKGSAKEAGGPVVMDNLKASLLKLSAAITESLKDGSKLDAQVTAKLVSLSSFTSEVLQTIEARQAVNVIYQQNESGLYLQIPLAMGGSLRQADVFITPDDKNASGARKYSSCSIMIFLDLDYLGEISIDASLRDGQIRCIIKCESEEVKQLVDASSRKLKEALAGIGYGIEQIDCLKVSEMGQKRIEYIEQQILGSTDLINHFA